MLNVEYFLNHTHHYGKKNSVHIVPYRIMKRREKLYRIMLTWPKRDYCSKTQQNTILHEV